MKIADTDITTSQLEDLHSALAEAKERARIAYQFVPGSYTYTTLAATAKALSIIEGMVADTAIVTGGMTNGRRRHLCR